MCALSEHHGAKECAARSFRNAPRGLVSLRLALRASAHRLHVVRPDAHGRAVARPPQDDRREKRKIDSLGEGEALNREGRARLSCSCCAYPPREAGDAPARATARINSARCRWIRFLGDLRSVQAPAIKQKQCLMAMFFMYRRVRVRRPPPSLPLVRGRF